MNRPFNLSGIDSDYKGEMMFAEGGLQLTVTTSEFTLGQLYIYIYYTYILLSYLFICIFPKEKDRWTKLKAFIPHEIEVIATYMKRSHDDIIDTRSWWEE